jgi:AraC-like DNA-binding protein
MEQFEFQTEIPFHFNWSGKFVAPDENWMHITRNLADFELIVMTKGELYIAADEKKYTVQEGEYILMRPPCRQYGYKPSQCTFYWTHFAYHNWQNNPVVDSGQPAAGSPRAIMSPEHSDSTILLPMIAKIPRIDRLIVLFKQLHDCDRKYHNRNLNNYSLTTILCELYSQLYLSAGQATVKREQMQLYTDIVDYISWRIHENIKVSEIATYFEYNEKYLTTFFKKISGTPLKNYILSQKMELAKALLTDSNQPIAQIGYDLGFTDNHNFSSAFKKITGQSPSEYREAYAERMLFHQ